MVICQFGTYNVINAIFVHGFRCLCGSWYLVEVTIIKGSVDCYLGKYPSCPLQQAVRFLRTFRRQGLGPSQGEFETLVTINLV